MVLVLLMLVNPKPRQRQTLSLNVYREWLSLRTLVTRNDLIARHHCAIQDKDEDFYLQFQIIICGLDSVEARRWINATLVNMVDWDDPQRTLKPLIDGGTEGNMHEFRIIEAH